jgi:hypothetical protein
LIDPLELREDELSKMRQADDRFASLEQQSAELAFQRLDCAGQRWLRDTTASRGTGEAFLLTQCEEVGNLVRLDRHVPPIDSQAASHLR